MKLLKEICEKAISSKEIFKMIDRINIVDKNENVSNFKEIINSEMCETFGFDDYKDLPLFNKFKQNVFLDSFLGNKKYEMFFKKLPYEAKKEKIDEYFNHSSFLLFSLVYFYKEGQKIVAFKDKSLLEQFENTKIDTLKFQDLNIFLDYFYLSVEKSINKVYVDGIFIQNQKDVIELVILIKRNGFLNQIQCVIKKNGNIEDSLKSTIEEFQAVVSEMKEGEIKNSYEKEIPDDMEIISYSFKMVINSIMFFNLVKVKNNKNYTIIDEDKTSNIALLKNDKTYSKRNANSNYTYYFKNNSEENNEFLKSNKERKITHRFVVSGHYRKQSCGERNNPKHKIIWIEPFIKGSKNAIINKNKAIII